MVSETITQSDVTVGMPGNSRGFIPEETVVAAGPGAAVTLYRPFWRPVLAGATFALSVFILSWYLMLGFHVGVTSAGAIMLGAGAAIWLWVTACVAYYFGGMIASAMTASPSAMGLGGSGMLKGAVLWAVSLPLGLISYGYIARSGTTLADLSLPHASVNTAINATGLTMGFYWAAFIMLGLALIFAIAGSMAGCACRKTDA